MGYQNVLLHTMLYSVFLYFHLNIGHIIRFLMCFVNTWDHSSTSIKWGCVIWILLYCFVNCFFFSIQWIQLQWSFIMCVELSVHHKTFLKRQNKEWVCGDVKKTGYPLLLVYVSLLWLVFAQEIQQWKGLQFSSGHLGFIYFTAFL